MVVIPIWDQNNMPFGLAPVGPPSWGLRFVFHSQPSWRNTITQPKPLELALTNWVSLDSQEDHMKPRTFRDEAFAFPKPFRTHHEKEPMTTAKLWTIFAASLFMPKHVRNPSLIVLRKTENYKQATSSNSTVQNLLPRDRRPCFWSRWSVPLGRGHQELSSHQDEGFSNGTTDQRI